MKSTAPKRVLGIDSSSTGVAWTVVEDGIPVASGKIRLDKLLFDAKLNAIVVELPKVLEAQKPDRVAIEMPIFVKNPATARLLSFIVGCIMTVLTIYDYSFDLVDIASWKSFIGYTNLSSAFQAHVKDVLGKTEGTKFLDRLRKSQTQRILKNRFPEFDVMDNDISDSAAISLWFYNKLYGGLEFKKDKSIAFDLKEFSKLGIQVI
jgi:Holliday junction resolvasome RuvABC endonuclease subunit